MNCWTQKFGTLLTAFLVIVSLNGCQNQSNSNLKNDPNINQSIANLSSNNNQSLTTYKLGILSINSAVSVTERYSPLIDYLKQTTGYQFELVPLTQETQFELASEKAIDFITTNPLAGVQVQRLYQTEFLVTYSLPQTKTEFSGLIIVNAESEIQTLEDLRGKKGACVNLETAAAGCTFQMYHLLQQGINPKTDFASLIENKSQENIVLGVLNGVLDFGFIRTGQLEKMQAKGLLYGKEELRVLEPIDDDFFYAHTTALYPEWSIAVLPHVDQDIAQQVEQALLTIPPDDPTLKSIGIEEFVPAVSYSKLETLIEELQLKTWDVP